MNNELLLVTCPDGVIRHEGYFATLGEAHRFVQWGHACLAHGHKVTPIARWAEAYAFPREVNA